MQVTDMLGFGGREKVTIDLANGLCQNKHTVQFLTLSNDKNDQAPLLNKTIKNFELPAAYKSLGGLRSIAYWFKCLPVFIKILKAEKPDVVHTHLFFHRLYFASLAIKLSRIKTYHYNTIHTSGLFYKEKGIINRIRLATEQLAISLNKGFIIAISDEVYKNAVKYFKTASSGIALIYNGVDNKQFDFHLRSNVSKTDFGFKQDDIIVTYVARITEGKDHLTLLQAWKTVCIQVPKARLCLAGDGELKLQMQEFCKKENIELSVTFLGTVKDIPKLLAITDIGVFTSLFEGFSIAVLEQMFMLVPVIATNIPPFNMLLQNNKNGFLFTPGNKQQLSDLLLMLINNKSLREVICKAGYETVQKFSITKMIKNHEEAYERIPAI